MESKFIEIFTGLERNYGYCNIKNGFKDKDTGKIKFKPGDYGWSQNPITSQDYRDHLEGKKSIGIQPCNDEGMVKFAAIDIDPEKYEDFNIKKYLDIIVENKIPIIPVKSKSNGLHLYVFLKEKVKASSVRNFLDKLLFVFKLESTTEIFPKQTELGTSEDGKPTNGNFINLPYYNKTERVAINPHDGNEFTFEEFLKVVEVNKKTEKDLEDFANSLVKEELIGGAEEFIDGPPCLQAMSKNKFDDGRDRFLYNYMVFAKKKYKDDWHKKVKEAARNYFIYDDTWDDKAVEAKIRAWSKDTKGHTCNEDPIRSRCIKSVCVKRLYGIASDTKLKWPMLSNLTKINYKPNPEWYFTVEQPGGESVEVHANNITKLRDQRELKGIMMEQAHIVVPIIKSSDFHEIQSALFKTVTEHKPPSGTSPEEQLHKYITDYLYNGTSATSHASFQSGAVLIEEEYAYFTSDFFFRLLKNKEWKMKEDRTGRLMQKKFKAEFGKNKRYPKKDTEKKSNPPIRCVKIPIEHFHKEESPEEIIPMQDRENIL
jgi:hypothetical protein